MWARMRKLFQRREDEEGQGLVEYGLILGLIAVEAIAALNATGTNVNATLQRIGQTVGAAGAGPTLITTK